MSKLVKKALMVLCAGAFSASVFAATQAPTSSTQGTAPQAMATSGNSATPAQKKMMHKHHQRMKACMKQGNSKKACKKMMAKKRHDQMMQKQQNKSAAQQ